MELYFSSFVVCYKHRKGGDLEMYVFILAIFSVIVIYTVLGHLSKRRWTLVYTALGHDKYFRVTSKLASAGIKYKTVTPIGTGRIRNIEVVSRGDSGYTQYDIYVKKGEEGKAAKALEGLY